ncbi:hypothetical protein [Streptomyces axinellae]|uniref:Uncharacterized protein n=1 Tax=Streptomyces axinellae TaxID=552788 RepID=A0ABN3Q5P4_9ACTN
MPEITPSHHEVRLLVDTYQALLTVRKILSDGVPPERKSAAAVEIFREEMKRASDIVERKAYDDLDSELHSRLEDRFQRGRGTFPTQFETDFYLTTRRVRGESVESVRDRNLPESEQVQAVFVGVNDRMRSWLADQHLVESRAFVWATASAHALAGEKAPPLELAGALNGNELSKQVDGARHLFKDKRELSNFVEALDDTVQNSPRSDSMEELAGVAALASVAESGREQLGPIQEELARRVQHNRESIFRERLVTWLNRPEQQPRSAQSAQRAQPSAQQSGIAEAVRSSARALPTPSGPGNTRGTRPPGDRTHGSPSPAPRRSSSR